MTEERGGRDGWRCTNRGLDTLLPPSSNSQRSCPAGTEALNTTKALQVLHISPELLQHL